MARKFYHVLYDFTAVESGELTVSAHERVVSIPDDDGIVVQDDWIHVENLAYPDRKGFVPLGYLEEMPDPDLNKKPPARPSIRVVASDQGPGLVGIANATESTPSKATTSHALHVLSQSARLPDSPRQRPVLNSQTTPRLASHRAQMVGTMQSQTLLSPGKAAFTPGMSGGYTPRNAHSHTPKTLGRTPAPTFTGTPRVPNLSTSMNTGDYEQLIKKNSEYFERLKASRYETFTHLNEMVDSLGKRLNESSQMCNDLVAQVGELDELIEAERRRWKQQLEMEKTTGLISAAENTRTI